MYITVDDIKNGISLDYPIDNRNGDKKVGLIRAYFVYSFYNIEKDEEIHLKNGEPKYDSLTGKSVIDPTIN